MCDQNATCSNTRYIVLIDATTSSQDFESRLRVTCSETEGSWSCSFVTNECAAAFQSDDSGSVGSFSCACGDTGLQYAGRCVVVYNNEVSAVIYNTLLGLYQRYRP